MRLAFYAPLKPLDHPVPSGDRRMARSLKKMLEQLGCDVRIACRLRSLDKSGDPIRQRRLAELGAKCVARIQRSYGRDISWQPDLWFTYHAFHKAPDHIGPSISEYLNIPYINAEASIAGKQTYGRWRQGHAISVNGARFADGLIAMTDVDKWNLQRWVANTAKIHLLSPFIETKQFIAASNQREVHRQKTAEKYGLDTGKVWLIVAAMMRDDVKKSSYFALAEALGSIRRDGWEIIVVGDGPAKYVVEERFKSQVRNQARFIGELSESEMPLILASSDIYVWPAFEEAYGIGLLEAQAAGLPVVACREGGVGDVVRDGHTGLLAPDRSMHRFATNIELLIEDTRLREEFSRNAQQYMSNYHQWDSARKKLGSIVNAAVQMHRERSA